MAGHSKFKNIQFRKGAQDKKRAKLFAKISKEITVAAKLGLPDPAANPRLRSAIALGRAQNMPKDNIERAVKKSYDENAENYEEVRYEGFGIEGVGIIVESLTDNRNRTSSDVKSTFSKYNGSTGAPGSVNYLFERKAIFQFEDSSDELINIAIENACLDFTENSSGLSIEFTPQEFKKMNEIFELNNFKSVNAEVAYVPTTLIMLDLEQFKSISKLIEAFEELDDIQNVYTNFDIDENLLDNTIN